MHPPTPHPWLVDSCRRAFAAFDRGATGQVQAKVLARPHNFIRHNIGLRGGVLGVV